MQLPPAPLPRQPRPAHPGEESGRENPRQVRTVLAAESLGTTTVTRSCASLAGGVGGPRGQKETGEIPIRSRILGTKHTGEAVSKPLTGHKSQITALAYSSDGATLLSCSADNTIKVRSVCVYVCNSCMCVHVYVCMHSCILEHTHTHTHTHTHVSLYTQEEGKLHVVVHNCYSAVTDIFTNTDKKFVSLLVFE